MPDIGRWILVGGETLLGKEVRELVEDRKLPVLLIECGPRRRERVLARTMDEEAAVLEDLDTAMADGASAVLLTGDWTQAEEALSAAREAGIQPAFIDMTGVSEGRAETRLEAPSIRNPAGPVHGPILVVAHPAAIALASLLIHANAHARLRSAVAIVLEPASARGKEALDELHQQTRSLFSFQQMPKKVFDAQATFNLLPRLGDHAGEALSASQSRLERHLSSLLAPGGVPMPSLRVIHAPVFHGYCASLWLEFEARPAAAQLGTFLARAGLDVREAGAEPASNVASAGEAGVVVSDIAEDSNHPRALWMWMSLDNLRETAVNAVALAGLAAQEGRA